MKKIFRLIKAIIYFLFFEKKYSIIGEYSEQEEESFSINIENTTDEMIFDFHLFDAGRCVYGLFNGGKWSTDGVFFINGIKVSSDGIKTYQQHVVTLCYRDLFLSKCTLKLLNGSSAQIIDPFKVQNLESNGNLYQYPIIPIINPLTEDIKTTECNMIHCYSNEEYTHIDCLSSIIFGIVYPKSSFTILFYPVRLIHNNVSSITYSLSLSRIFVIIVLLIITLHFLYSC